MHENRAKATEGVERVADTSHADKVRLRRDRGFEMERRGRRRMLCTQKSDKGFSIGQELLAARPEQSWNVCEISESGASNLQVLL